MVNSEVHLIRSRELLEQVVRGLALARAGGNVVNIANAADDREAISAARHPHRQPPQGDADPQLERHRDPLRLRRPVRGGAGRQPHHRRVPGLPRHRALAAGPARLLRGAEHACWSQNLRRAEDVAERVLAARGHRLAGGRDPGGGDRRSRTLETELRTRRRDHRRHRGEAARRARSARRAAEVVKRIQQLEVNPVVAPAARAPRRPRGRPGRAAAQVHRERPPRARQPDRDRRAASQAGARRGATSRCR